MRYLVCLLFLSACGDSNVPLDAGTRRTIDSLATARLGEARAKLDSLCKAEHQTVLPVLIDSIKKVREAEIERQLQRIRNTEF